MAGERESDVSKLTFLVLWMVLILSIQPAAAEDGYDLWLRYRPLAPAAAAQVRAAVGTIRVEGAQNDPTLRVAEAELQRAFGAMLGTTGQGGTLLVGTPASSPAIAALHLPLESLGREGYLLRSTTIAGKPATVVAANTAVGALYGSFALIQKIQTGADPAKLDISSAPKLKLRIIAHWDRLDRTIERGYAGFSLWDWWNLPDVKDPRYTDYARAEASIGINGVVLNNVNADTRSLTAPYIAKAAALADIFRPYGIKVYLTARWSAPIEIGGLKTADPLDPGVKAWWKAKADEIYRAIPDFGGFQVKANSEGEPGPGDYKRTHAEGANTLAAALAPHGGIVNWRAFVYSAENTEDRHKQAYSEFKPTDGMFAPNATVQVKNGAIDFQPREPFHPMFGAMPKTPLLMEFQISKEYLGWASHLVYLGTMWEEVLKSDTFAQGPGSTVAKVIEGKLGPVALTGMVGDANTGTDRDWSGSTFNQANWFAFGRLAWDPDASSEAIAREWAELTFGNDPKVIATVVPMMMESREAAVNYMTPLGLAHQMATDSHYGPAPWVSDLKRPEWNPTYYARADRNGIGFERTKAGTDALSQYSPGAAAQWADPKTTPERNLLWFHHVPWSWRMKSGKTLWEDLLAHYALGVRQVGDMRRAWASLEGHVDKERFAKTSALLAVQEREAQYWRDASVAYWLTVSGLPLPAGEPAPPHDLAYYIARQGQQPER
jgi:alpha-glucuronidase